MGDTKDETPPETEAMSFAEFLETVPPSQMVRISDLVERSRNSEWWRIATPELQLHCPSEHCNGTRFFRRQKEGDAIQRGKHQETFVRYFCSNCRTTPKTYALLVNADGESSTGGECYKYGEYPVFGPPTPPRLISLIGPDRDGFLKGRRSENQGLGIGAFVYYRRVVENQKDRILDQIIKVAVKIGTPADVVDVLKTAMAETQFSTALASVKDALPKTLWIDGRDNPLTLLHAALSQGLHGKTDEECLEIAQAIRVVLGDLSERLGQALADEAELKHAVSRLKNLGTRDETKEIGTPRYPQSSSSTSCTSKAETDEILTAIGAIDNAEVRERIAADPDATYSAIEVDEVPETEEVEEPDEPEETPPSEDQPPDKAVVRFGKLSRA